MQYYVWTDQLSEASYTHTTDKLIGLSRPRNVSTDSLSIGMWSMLIKGISVISYAMAYDVTDIPFISIDHIPIESVIRDIFDAFKN